MATTEEKKERKYDVMINVRVLNITAEQAQIIEDAIRDIADDYANHDVNANKTETRTPQ